jgi:hypothetical protein
MTVCSKEVLEKYQVRKTRKQKREFQELLKGFAKEKDYEMKIEKGPLGAENIVFGNWLIIHRLRCNPRRDQLLRSMLWVRPDP